MCVCVRACVYWSGCVCVYAMVCVRACEYVLLLFIACLRVFVLV